MSVLALWDSIALPALIIGCLFLVGVVCYLIYLGNKYDSDGD